MPYLALSRIGVAAFLAGEAKASALWIGSGLLSESELRLLRARGISVTTFVHPVKTQEDVDWVLSTIEEHHPEDAVSVEAIPLAQNPRSYDIGQAFLWREPVVGVTFKHNDRVSVRSGPSAGATGLLTSLVCLEPEPIFLLRLEAGEELQVPQSSVAHRADA